MASTGYTTSILELLKGCPHASSLAMISAARTFVAYQVVATLNLADPRTNDQKHMDFREDGEIYFDRRQEVRLGYGHCIGCGVIGDSWARDTSSSTRLSATSLQSGKNGKCQGSVVEHRRRIENRRFPSEVFLSDRRSFRSRCVERRSKTRLLGLNWMRAAGESSSLNTPALIRST